MDNQYAQVIEYIKIHLNSGFSEQDISNNLLANGWTEDMVNQAFSAYTASATPVAEAALPAPEQSQPNTQLTAQQTALPAKRKKSKAWLIMIILVVILALLSVPAIIIPLLGAPSQVKVRDNTSRQNDVAMIAGAISEYPSAHSGALLKSTAASTTDQGLVLCGVDCTPANSATIKLGFYENTPTAVSFKPYSSSLTVPDLKTVYIVQDAKCRADKKGIGLKTDPQNGATFVVLYATQSEGANQQQCTEV